MNWQVSHPPPGPSPIISACVLNFWVDPEEQLVGVFLVRAQAGPVVAAIQRDFETAVMHAVVE